MSTWALSVCGLSACARSAAEPEVRVQLACKTSRFAWVATSSRARGGAALAEPEDHHHGSQELILPLVLGRSRCPLRGRVVVRVSSPPRHAPLEVEVRGLGRVVRERVAPGSSVPLVATWPLGALEPGRHALEIAIDGRSVRVPVIEVVP